MRRLRHLWDHPDAAALTALGLHALQHRGQEGGRHRHLRRQALPHRKALGLVGDAFSDPSDHRQSCPAPGDRPHRYSTTGERGAAQRPAAVCRTQVGGFAIAHNGNLTNGLTCAARWCATAPSISRPRTPRCSCIWSRSQPTDFVDRFIECDPPDRGRLRDGRHDQQEADRRARSAGIRPLVLGELDGKPILLGNLRARHHRREVYPRRSSPAKS
jgi:amidophosphoribosyltransferase